MGTPASVNASVLIHIAVLFVIHGRLHIFPWNVARVLSAGMMLPLILGLELSQPSTSAKMPAETNTPVSPLAIQAISGAFAPPALILVRNNVELSIPRL